MRLTLLPILASAAAVAHAQAPGDAPPAPAAPAIDPAVTEPVTVPGPVLVPPPLTEPPSNAPGMTPPLSEWCQEHPEDEDCPTSVWIDTTYEGGVIHRGGFGGYFHSGGHWGGHGG
jgi:hypothetical protein